MIMILEARLSFCIPMGQMAAALAAAERKHGGFSGAVFMG